MTDFKHWIKKEQIEFKNHAFGDINLTSIKALTNPENYDFNTALVFDNCEIKSFHTTLLVLGKQVTFKNCTIGRLSCHSSYFSGGLKMLNCTVTGYSTFDCGVHNINNNGFVIDNCTFHCFLDFFDVYFEGPVQITNNQFKSGTNLELYLQVPYGIKEGIPLQVKNNKGQLNKTADNT